MIDIENEALARLEQALLRLERATAKLEAAPRPAANDQLAERHARLRSSVEGALARLDALLAEEAA